MRKEGQRAEVENLVDELQKVDWPVSASLQNAISCCSRMAHRMSLWTTEWLLALLIIHSAGGIAAARQQVPPPTDRTATMEKTTDEFHTFGGRVAVSSMERIRGKPFQTEFEEVRTRQSTGEVLRDWGSMAQDSEGRTREEHHRQDAKDATTAHFTAIFDAATLTFYAIDHQTGEVQKMEMGRIIEQQKASVKVQPAADNPPLTAQLPPLQREPPKSLGEKMIEGVSCRGTLYTSPTGGETTEQWFSDRLFRAVLEITRAKDFKIVYRLFNIQLTEPDPSLFVVPVQAP